MNFPSFMCCVVLSLFLIVVSAMAGAPSPANGAAVQGKPVNFTVRLSNGQNATLVGFLYFNPNFKLCFKEGTIKKTVICLLERRLSNRTLQVLAHGFTYNHTYWDSKKINGVDYSYARFMADQGYAVLALDLLGTGLSSAPDGDLLNIDESASVLAQVLSSLRTRHNPIHRKFKRIALVGHSVGTVTSVFAMGTEPGIADVLVATGWSYAPHVVQLNPELIDAALKGPDSFIRFPPEERTRLFYFNNSADPDVIAFDNAKLADQFPRGILFQGLPLVTALADGEMDQIKLLSRVDRVTVPVLVQLGEFDLNIAPGRLAGQEAALYASSPDVTVQAIGGIGHSFNLHRNNLESWTRIDQWIEQRLGK